MGTGLDPEASQYRILSIDGGGLYGLVSALWLQQLCQEDETLLRDTVSSPGTGASVPGRPQYIFSGASAGAVTVLLLAKHDNPRDGLAEAVDFWKARVGAFSNVLNPMAAWLSLFNLGGWTGEQDFQRLLQHHFGTTKLKELKHPVVITTFDWTGESYAPGWKPDPFTSFAPPFQPARGSPGAEWQPRLFSNISSKSNVSENDVELPVAQVAYWAATPPGIRAVRDGLGDAASFGINPSLDALVVALHTLARQPGQEPAPSELEKMAILAIGNGGKRPAFWLRNFDFSSLQMGLSPTNPFTGNFFVPSVSLTLDAPMEEANHLCRLLLGTRVDGSRWRMRYYRLNPGIMPLPVLVATELARFEPWRDLLVRGIYDAVGSAPSQVAVREAVAFTRQGWQHTRPLHPAHVTRRRAWAP
jgi:hypothetical protein